MRVEVGPRASLGGAAAAAALSTFGILVFAARAPYQAARFSELRASDGKAAAQLFRPAPSRSGLALCPSGARTASADVTRSFRAAGSGAGIAIRSLEFAPLAGPTPSGLTGESVRLIVAGGEKGLAGFLRTVGQARLPIALDVVEVKRLGGGGLQAEFSGRLLCRSGA